MLTGDQIRAARERAGWSQAELAERVGVSQRSIGNYERSQTVPRSASSRVEEVLADFLNREFGNPLREASDVALLAEIARRFDRAREREEQTNGTAKNHAGVSPAEGPPVADFVSARDGESFEVDLTPGSVNAGREESTESGSQDLPLASHPKTGRESTGRRLRAQMDEVGEGDQDVEQGE